MLDFAWYWMFLLLPLPLLVRKWLPAAQQHDQAALRVPFLNDFDSYSADNTHVTHRMIYMLATLAWVALIVSVARPQWYGDAIEIPVSGRDLMMAVDLSGSMEAQDFRLNGRAVDRLTATKHVASDFINRRVGDRIGLILFGRNAYLQAPLTFDRTTVNTLLDESVIGLAGKETAIGDAIGLAIRQLKETGNQDRVLILLTDGANTAGEITPIKAAELAARYKLKIYTIGIGADELIVDSMFFGKRRINPSADLDEKTLSEIAKLTGGRYFRARDLNELNKIYELLDELEPVEKESQSFRPVKTLFYWPLALAFALVMAIGLIRIVSRGVL